MSTIFEIFGYRLEDESEEAKFHRANARCPFMELECDGGGNRYLTRIDLDSLEHRELKALYPNRTSVVPGVCSLIPIEGQSPWIVCPRRLLVLGRQQAGTRRFQRGLEAGLLRLLKYPSGTRLGVWKEVKLNYTSRSEGIEKTFDYTFDYIMMPLADVSIVDTINNDISTFLVPTQQEINKRKVSLERRGFQISADPTARGGYLVHDYPQGKPSIIEIMTSSTSGGNKKDRTQVAQAFSDAILRKRHKGPGINYRQVWARMASQLLVKSEVALGWGGSAIWVVQDVLVEYITKSTGLDIGRFVRHEIGEVNMLSFSYGNLGAQNHAGVFDLPIAQLFAGPVAPVAAERLEHIPSFVDIVRLPVQPPIQKLLELITKDGPPGTHVLAPGFE